MNEMSENSRGGAKPLSENIENITKNLSVKAAIWAKSTKNRKSAFF